MWGEWRSESVEMWSPSATRAEGQNSVCFVPQGWRCSWYRSKSGIHTVSVEPLVHGPILQVQLGTSLRQWFEHTERDEEWGEKSELQATPC